MRQTGMRGLVAVDQGPGYADEPLARTQNTQTARRALITGVPFYLPITVPFTSTLNETVTVYTQAVQNAEDLEIIGGIMDLETVQGQFTIAKQAVFSSGYIPLAMYFGKPDGPKPVIWHQPPTPLGRRQRVRIDLINVGGEAAGTLVLICRQVGVAAPMAQALLDYQNVGLPDVATIDSKFAGTVLNDVKQNSFPLLNDHFIWKTLHTTLAGASARIRGINGSVWMDDFVPLWALSGRAGSQIPNHPLQPQCFIPAGFAVAFEFKNIGVGGVAETSGAVYLGGQRIPAR